MNYSPKPTDMKMRIIYLLLFFVTAACITAPTEGVLNTALSGVALAALVAASFLVIKFELTLYTYILVERASVIDFYVDKQTGKKGVHICYFTLSDAREIVKYGKETKNQLKEKYKVISFHNYAKNVFCGDKYYIVFENGSHFDAVLIEPDTAFLDALTKYINK